MLILLVTMKLNMMASLNVCSDLIRLIKSYSRSLTSIEAHDLIISSPTHTQFKLMLIFYKTTNISKNSTNGKSNKIRVHALGQKVNETCLIIKIVDVMQFDCFDVVYDKIGILKAPTEIMFAQMKHVRMLNSSYHNIKLNLLDSYASWYSLREIKHNNPYCQSIDLWEDFVSARGQIHLFDIRILVQALQSNSNVCYLSMCSCNLNDGVIEELIDIIANNQNPQIYKIILSDNNITDYGAKLLAHALKKNTHLEHLELQYNEISQQGVVYFMEALQFNTTLTRLGLDWPKYYYSKIHPLIDRNKRIAATKSVYSES